MSRLIRKVYTYLKVFLLPASLAVVAHQAAPSPRSSLCRGNHSVLYIIILLNLIPERLSTADLIGVQLHGGMRPVSSVDTQRARMRHTTS